MKDGSTLRVSDVATVRTGAPDRTSLIVGQGGNAIAISVSQQVGANILTVRQGLEDAAHRARKPRCPPACGWSRRTTSPSSSQSAIANVRDAILIGGGLAVLVLLLFLRNWRLTLVAACTLPLTVVSTFLFMWLFGESINLMSMGGLAVAIGLVIDDAVVVVENIHRRLAEGGGADADRTGDGRARRAGRRLDAHDGGRLRAARPAVGRRRRFLQGAVDHALGRRADLDGAGALPDSAARARRLPYPRAGDGAGPSDQHGAVGPVVRGDAAVPVAAAGRWRC